MREILFRGKRIKDNLWDVSRCPDGVMHSGTVIEDFIPETVGQYTGLQDRNGKKIFEGDILQPFDRDNRFVVRFGRYKHWGNATFQGFYAEWIKDDYLRVDIEYWTSKSKVIGNIWDNSDLLEDTV